MLRLDADGSHGISIDGTTLGSAAQTLVQSMPCGFGGEHTGDGQGMGTERSLPALLEIQLATLGFGIPELLVSTRYAQPSGTNQEGRAHATCP